MAEKAGNSKYGRVLLKLSGEVFKDSDGCISPEAFADFARRLKAARDSGTEIAIVIGGGNIFRGMTGAELGTDRVVGDTIGMLATIINSMALSAACGNIGLESTVLSATHMPKICEMYTVERAERHLAEGRIVILGGGTGNPFFTTDSAAALRAAELGADALLKATKVDGIYSADPVKDPTAELFSDISCEEALRRDLRVMDASAFSLCRENKIPIVVFNFFNESALTDVLDGKRAGTMVRD